MSVKSKYLHLHNASWLIKFFHICYLIEPIKQFYHQGIVMLIIKMRKERLKVFKKLGQDHRVIKLNGQALIQVFRSKFDALKRSSYIWKKENVFII